MTVVLLSTTMLGEFVLSKTLVAVGSKGMIELSAEVEVDEDRLVCVGAGKELVGADVENSVVTSVSTAICPVDVRVINVV